ncbi:SYFA ligase, partial [Probosciger aterrimus]|nr:SYFA ligase [Probosciger aterrimus]
FTEMPTQNFVESSFWNFDALFQPQQHPARDQHDTFFLQDPAEAPELPPGYTTKVKKVHSQGGYGSQGYKYEWRLEEARRNLLRTHTTAASARMLYRLAQQERFSPVKYFSIDRVFRNESLDATHLAEFHQVEGVVADRGLTLGHLMGILRQFFTKLGITQLRFKPAYNPYTEPSMEVFSYHEGLKKWVEVGNSGIFRP